MDSVGAASPPLPFSSIERRIGLYPAADFRITSGRCSDCAVIPQALSYFTDEAIAVPGEGRPLAGFARGVRAFDDVATWAAHEPADAPPAYPGLVWIAAPDIARGARLTDGGKRIAVAGSTMLFDVVPKIPLNRSYYDGASIAWLASHTLAIRGTLHEGRCIARTIWPEAFRLEENARRHPIEPTPEALRALVRAEPRGGAQSPFDTMTLWERSPGAARRRADQAVLALVLNGAQGDDDEAHGGHFAAVTGRVSGDGAIGDWLTNNFYTLDTFSEKGITAAMLPLDNYLADLNSGQAWYRPSYILAALLRRDRTAARVQGALARAYNQFYRHQLVYQHATMNCASITIDVLRALGWRVPSRGPTSTLLAALGLPYYAAIRRGIAQAQQTYDYLTEDQTRLFPAAAFEDIGADLLRFALGRPGRTLSAFESLLTEDLDALIFLRVPQFPSSRAWGDCPVVTHSEYMARLPDDRSKLQFIPVPARPFPAKLRDPDLLPPLRQRSERAVTAWAVASIVGIPWILWRRWRRRARGG